MKISDLFETGGEQAEHDSRSLLCTCAASKGQPHSTKCPQYRKPAKKKVAEADSRVFRRELTPAENKVDRDARQKFALLVKQGKREEARNHWASYLDSVKKFQASESLDEAGPEWIKHPTSKGVMVKNPRWEPPAKPARASSGLNRSEAMKKRHADQAAKLDKLYWKISAAISETFPDGDPWDESSAWAKRIFNLDDWADTGKYINAAVKKHESYASLSDWLAGMWDEYQRDQISDANNGHVENNNPFYRVGENGEIEPEGNPWK